jgi:hypothetical protein
MTIKADLVRRFSQLRVIARAMHIMAGRTRDSVPVHDALHKVVALHAILVRGAVWEVVKACLPERAVLELPEVLQT